MLHCAVPLRYTQNRLRRRCKVERSVRSATYSACRNFGVNLTRIRPSGVSALRHAHHKQDEFIYVVQGRPTLCTDEGENQLAPGMCAGFKSGSGNGHRLVNYTAEDVVYLEVGDRTPGDSVTYPDDDIRAGFVNDKWQFTHKDGSAY